MVVDWTRRAAVAGARLVVFPEMMITGYPVEDLALRASFVDASIATARRHRAAAGGRGPRRDRRGDRLSRPAGRPGAAGGPARRRAAGRRGAAVRRGDPGHLGQAPPAELRRVRRVPLLRPRRPAALVPDAGRRRPGGRGHRHLRRPLAGRRAGAGRLRRRGGPARGAERVALRARQAVRQAAAVAPAGPARPAPRWPTRTWSAARTSWSSTAARWWWTRPATLLAQAPQFCEQLLVTDLDLPAADPAQRPAETPVDAGDGTVITIRRLELKPAENRDTERFQAGPVTRQPGRWAAKCLDGPPGGLAEVYAALVLGTADYVRKNGFGSVDPGIVRRHRLGADRDDRGGRDRSRPGARGADAEPVLLRALGQRRRGPGQAPGPARPHGAGPRHRGRLQLRSSTA